MSRIGEGLRFEGYPLLLKLLWVRDQPGAKAVEAAATSVQDMGAKLGEATTAADGSMRGLGVSWVGPASDAAQRSSAQLTRGAEQTRLLSENGADRILEYGGSFEQMRPKITYEDMSHLNLLDVPAESFKFGVDFWSGAGTEDKMSVIARNMDHDAAANDALETHRTLAQAADDRFMTAGVDPPPSTPGDGGTATPGPVGGGGSSVGSSAIGPVASASAAPAGTASAQPAPPAAVPPPGTGAASGPGSTALGATPVGGPAGVVPSGVGAGPGRDGTASGRGGTAPGTGGAAPGAGGRAPGVGGTAPVTGGVPSGVGGPAGGARGTGTAAGPTGAAGAAGGAVGTGASGRVPDPGQARARLGEQFGRDVAAGSPGFRAGPGIGGPGLPGSGGPVAGLAPGVRGGAGTGSTAGGSPYGRGLPSGDAGSRSGGAWRGGLGENTSRLPGEAGTRAWSRTPGMPGEGLPVRPTGEPGVAGRSGAGYGGYAPMMGGVGGARTDGDAHRNRYLLPSSEPFDVDLPHAPPVLGPDEEDRG